MRWLDAALLATSLALAVALAVTVVDPQFTYVGGISTDAVGLGHEGGVSTSAQRLPHAGAVSTSALGLRYEGSVSTSAKRLGYVEPCFVYVNGSWFALLLRAVHVNGSGLTVTAWVNGTAYTVPKEGLLLNWSREDPVCAILDPIARIAFPSTLNGLVLLRVEGVEDGVAAWPVFTAHAVTAVYEEQPPQQPPQPPPQPPPEQPPPQQPPEQPPTGPPATQPAERPKEEPTLWERLRSWFAWAWEALVRWLERWWLLLLLLALPLVAAYLLLRRRGFVLVIEVKGL